jgi:ppGpp synthetase/RelA/SpoT-type nucleotidyltranferase
MKIAKPIRDAFENGEPIYLHLKKEVREILKPRVEDRGWFYRDRVKSLESYALKVETGRFPDYARLEDFFGCTVIVPTFSHLPHAIDLISKSFQVVEQRPPVNTETHKSASDFAFDELRLFAKLKPATDRPPSELEGIIFEIQIMTILQYAWGIATHDLIYKTDEVSWPKARIAYQVKAMLEHAELAIAEAGRLSSSPAVSKQDRRTKDILKVIEQLRLIWVGSDILPTDLKRLAESIVAVLRAGDVSVERLNDILLLEQRRIGLLPNDLSPYSFIVQALANHPDLNFEANFKRAHIRTKLVIHEGMELPASMRAPHNRIIMLQAVTVAM